MLKSLTAAAVSFFFAFPAFADVIKKNIRNAEIVGSGRLKYLFWEVYDATLHAPSGKWDREKPFAITLHYLVSASGDDIADRSAKMIRKLGFTDEVKLAAWHSQMRRIFPNVKKGTKLIGLYSPDKSTRFFKGTQQIGHIKDPEFGFWFFNIWLGKNTSEPDLRRKLLGRK